MYHAFNHEPLRSQHWLTHLPNVSKSQMAMLQFSSYALGMYWVSRQAARWLPR